MSAQPRAVLHATWIMDRDEFLFWAEDLNVAQVQSRYQSYMSNHFLLWSQNQLVEWLRRYLPDANVIPRYGRITLPGSGNDAQPSPLAEAHGLKPVEADDLMEWQIAGATFRPYNLLQTLLEFPPDNTNGVIYANDLAFWMQFAYHTLVFIRDERFMPMFVETGYGNARQALWSWWGERHLIHNLAQAMPHSALVKYSQYDAIEDRNQLLMVVLDLWIDTFVRNHIRLRQFDFLYKEQFDYLGYSRQAISNTLIKQWQNWYNNLPHFPPPFHLVLRLDEPTENDDNWSIAFLLQSKDDASIMINAADVWIDSEAFKHLQGMLNMPRIFLMKQIAKAGELSRIIEDNINDTKPSLISIDANQAYQFLIDDAPNLEKEHFTVIVPDWWQRRRKLRLNSQLSRMDDSLGLLGKETLFNYKWQVALGDNIQLSVDEFEQLVGLKQPLVQYQGQWVTLDERQIAAAKAFFEQQRTQSETLNLFEALHASVEAKALAEDNDDVIEIESPQIAADVEKAFKKLRKQQQSKKVAVPKNLQATLRPYQVKGYQWLVTMREMGLGACLADDMGLGKTIQTIALWLYERDKLKVKSPALLVCPTSVVGNWYHEIAQFAPNLRVLAHHGANRAKDDEFADAIQDIDVVLTSYAILQRDRKTLTAIEWDSVTLDEAQNIKNPSTKQAQAARALKSNFNLALTGTPIENRLGELWSLFRFLNPGYLGSRKTFQSRFATPIEKRNDKQAAKALRQLVAPFILRRVKNDPKVIQDLPDKFENRVFCNLTTEQATLYEAIVRTELENITQADNQMARRGAVLRMLVHLKQVCNHPVQYLKQGNVTANASGKLQRLTELLLDIRENGERALIFTQYARMGRLLTDYIADLLKDKVLFLHGGTPGTQRAKMVAEFQQDDGPPVFILSLKAGGTGLNLTKATQVFHFDRWYNPAVEDQATDRAYRIGQKEVVQVHKLICMGTLEERIDELLTRKRAIADQVIGSGEGWISEMSDSELRDLVSLRAETIR